MHTNIESFECTEHKLCIRNSNTTINAAERM